MELLIKFTDKSNSFTCGVEFGRILSKMESDRQVVDNMGFPVHKSNVQIIKETCKVYKYTPYFGKEYFGEWIEFLAIKNINSNQ